MEELDDFDIILVFFLFFFWISSQQPVFDRSLSGHSLSHPDQEENGGHEGGTGEEADSEGEKSGIGEEGVFLDLDRTGNEQILGSDMGPHQAAGEALQWLGGVFGFLVRRNSLLFLLNTNVPLAKIGENRAGIDISQVLPAREKRSWRRGAATGRKTRGNLPACTCDP